MPERKPDLTNPKNLMNWVLYGLAAVLIIKGFDKIDISLYLWVLFLIPILFAFGWEIYWKYKRGNIIDKMDIFYTILGGYLAILTLRF